MYIYIYIYMYICITKGLQGCKLSSYIKVSSTLAGKLQKMLNVFK